MDTMAAEAGASMASEAGAGMVLVEALSVRIRLCCWRRFGRARCMARSPTRVGAAPADVGAAAAAASHARAFACFDGVKRWSAA